MAQESLKRFARRKAREVIEVLADLACNPRVAPGVRVNAGQMVTRFYTELEGAEANRRQAQATIVAAQSRGRRADPTPDEVGEALGSGVWERKPRADG